MYHITLTELEDRVNDKEDQANNLNKTNETLKTNCFNLRNELNRVNDDIATIKDSEKDLEKQLRLLGNQNSSIKEIFEKESELIRKQMMVEKENDVKAAVDKYETEKKGLKERMLIL